MAESRQRLPPIQVSGVLALIAAGLGAGTLLGWSLGIEAMWTVVPGSVGMNPVTALGLLLAGGSLGLLSRAGASPRLLRPAQGCAALTPLWAPPGSRQSSGTGTSGSTLCGFPTRSQPPRRPGWGRSPP
jgi:hypothetical protein